ncbi:hypothetical protein AV530_005514 [Patagioenas fasciata monilis]|uniref:Uncharacterized protein n=1 Tax=Patagioenas fasciata monilis TaxID=372326 RepID=A0A1V4JLX7_PATFA|nr:hypothetical protein AV530_005514 [Patagioenas fasciata monilis]
MMSPGFISWESHSSSANAKDHLSEVRVKIHTETFENFGRNIFTFTFVHTKKISARELVLVEEMIPVT